MIFLNWLLSPFGKLLSMIAVLLTAISAVFLHGRRAGRLAEQDRSKRTVRKVQDKMDKASDKKLTDEEFRKRLEGGGF